MKVFIDGNDNIRWSIESDRSNIINSINRLGFRRTESILSADIIHNIWWNALSKKIMLFQRFKKNILVTASNFIDLEYDNFQLRSEFYKINNIADGWISPSLKQKRILENYGLKVFYQPFFLDLDIFKPIDEETAKNKINNYFNLPIELIKDKIVISSFQRDSLGADLKKPKWQKGPELLIYLLKDLPKDKYILLLAGPRRHFVRNECNKYNIPYLFVGKETNVDDIKTNTIDIKNMPLLYYLTDIYLVTSTSEGGPKAAMEAPATKTFIMSTDVGLTREFINEEFIFSDNDKYKRVLNKIVNEYELLSTTIKTAVEEQYKRCLMLLNKESMDTRLLKIYQELLNE